MRARALADSGDCPFAYRLTRELLATGREPAATAYSLLARLLIGFGRRAEAIQELETGLLQAGGGANAICRLRVLAWLGDQRAARDCFVRALKEARQAGDLTALLETLPKIFDHYGREENQRAMRTRAIALARSADAEAFRLCLRLDLALRDHNSFLRRLRSGPEHPEPWASMLRRTAEVLSSPRFPDSEAPKIFGIGLTKTGTSSLSLALDRLGYLQAHFLNPLTMQLLGDDDFAIFDAATDTPVSARFETLYAMYPNARFILSERPYKSWIASFRHHFRRSFGTSDFAELKSRAMSADRAERRDGLTAIHAALYFQYPDAKTAYGAHVRRVESFFVDKPAHKLLRHNVFAGDGWPELCGFLGMPIPADPYPWANRATLDSSV